MEDQNTSQNSPTVEALYAVGLKMTGMAYDSLEMSGFKSIIVEMIKNKLGFDISTPESINELSSDDIDTLRKFETENASNLVDFIRLADMVGYEAQHQHKINSLMDSLNDKSSLQNTFSYWFGAIVVLLSFIYIFCITWIEVPTANVRFSDTILGVLIGSIISVVMNYFFGSSINKKAMARRQEPIADKKEEDE